MGLLEGLDLYSGYGETEILHGVSVRLESGEIVAIIGPNGAGKSTLVKTIIVLLKPTKGRVVFEGRDITGRNPEDLVLDGLAYIPQMNNTFPSLTGRDNLEMGAIIRRPGRMVNLNPFLLPTLFARLNKGSGATRKGEREVWTRAQINDRGVAIILVEQNAKKALALADRGYVLEAGRNRYEGPGEALLHDPDVGRLYLGG